MAQPLYEIKVPGSLMVMGEHAVLQGKPALVAAIDRYIHVGLVPRKDRIIKIVSALGFFETSLDTLAMVAPFQFVLAAIQSEETRLPSGFELTIESEFSETIGFGSSAAVVVATLKVLQAFSKSHTNSVELLQQAKDVVVKVQGQGSGADVAASVYGGLVYYQLSKPVKALASVQGEFPNIYALYSGHKIPTPTVIAQVQAARRTHTMLYDQLFEAMAICTDKAYQVCLAKDWVQFGQLMNIHHGLQSALGVSHQKLESLVYQLRDTVGILGAKISGAGLGDCVIGVGDIGEERLNEECSLLKLAVSEDNT